MPESISLISSAKIEPAEFLAFLEYSDVLLHPDKIYDGRISRVNSHVWIVLDNTELKNFSTDEIELITQKLRAKPETHILLDVSKTPGSEQLAFEFACKFAKKWSCVIYDSSQRVYSTQELLGLCQTELGFV
ncbi:hypothetical protein VF14_26980 [Nostoc linckia z18]|jgi:hypothetical protein|uniref:Uncharacterized protein n=2 Tax=Nostoc linckia TaxID=92942 RepID=A0A9Q6EJN7_NOSLI|nr:MULTISPECIES: hypothetical protein [Nostoc]PHK38776.1 hypothetical protein VF12_16750 [Nostoc linckia z15]PHK44294.1 hypothetical protein VF13_22430 [Nostoc linckia z16]MBC1241115.1 hypothetical protein [Nostoc sp. 2RC]PHJ62774.1 hypothetical protein VF02_16610 [Nostoc linckia z1]PHJ66603.1 hypothetical protein VF05_18885 [Nostoc linckia z3]